MINFIKLHFYAHKSVILRCRDDTIIPVEVKSGSRTRARSLRSYLERFDLSHAVILAGKQGKKGSQRVQTWSLYDAQFLNDL